MSKEWTLNGPGKELWEFGRDGGFRELKDGPGLRWLLGHQEVKNVARERGIDEVAAARQLLDSLLSELDSNRASALRKWLQIEVSGFGQDLGVRRTKAGAELKTTARKDGVSGRTWERRYEQPSIRMLAERLAESDHTTPDDEPIRLAVLPLQVDTDNTIHRFMAKGLSQELVSRLSQLEQFSVLSQLALDDLTSDSGKVDAVRERTGADIALMGNLQDTQGLVSLEITLVDLRDETTLWSHTFNFAGSDAVNIEADIADRIAETLGFDLSGQEHSRLTSLSTTDPVAYELYLRAKGLSAENNADDNRVALGLVDQALGLDETFADAHALRGYLLWRDYFAGWGAVRDTLDLALTCVDEAIDLDSHCIDARYTRVRICWDLGRLEDALAEGRHALEDSPHLAESIICMARALNNAGLADLSLMLIRDVLLREPMNQTARKLLIWGLLMTADFEEAVSVGVAYHKLHPGDANTAWAVAGALLAVQDFDTAEHVCKEALEHDHTDATNWFMLGHIHAGAGNDAWAERVWRDGASFVSARVEEAPTNLRVRAWLANLYGCLGDGQGVREQVEFIKDREGDNAYLAYRLVGALATLGKVDDALRELKVAIDNGFFSVQLLRFEEYLSLACLQGGTLYESRVARLEDKVDNLRTQYRARYATDEE